jgi:hypothetical protein
LLNSGNLESVPESSPVAVGLALSSKFVVWGGKKITKRSWLPARQNLSGFTAEAVF